MFLDLGIGILMAMLVSGIFDFPLTLSFIAGGIVFSLLMDLDFLSHLKKGGSTRNAHRHRDVSHLPLIYIPVGIIISSFYSWPWAVLFGLCSFAHFLHDSVGIGWGVQWLYPFKKEHYTFFYRYQPKNKERLPRKLLYIWKHEEIDELAKKYGDEDWVRNIYYKWHPYAIVEFFVFLVALALLYYQIR